MRKRVIAMILCIVLMITVLSACGGTVRPEEPQIALAIIVSRRAGSNDFTESMYAEIKEWIGRAVYGGYISIIIGDGEPQVIKTYDKDVFKTDSNNAPHMNTQIIKRTEEVLGFIKDPSLRAKAEEADVLGAIVQAERSLYADEAKGLEKRIIIMDSGLPTVGFLNLLNVQINENGMENGDMEKIVSDLTSVRGRLPVLTDISVKWVGLGNVAAPQKLSNTIGVQIEELWWAVLRESGATFSDNDVRIKATGGTPNIYTEDKGGFPYVSTIHLTLPEPPPPPPPPQSDSDEPSVPPPSLTIKEVDFKPDTPIYANESNAKRILKEYADWIFLYIEAYPDSKVYVVGFIAKVSLGDENRLKTALSEQRAEAVKETMVELGVPEDKLVVIGLGENGGSNFRVDEFPNGVFDTVIAQLNRKVMLIPDLSEDAQKALDVKQELDNLRR